MALSIHDIITTIAEFGTVRTWFSMLRVNRAWNQAMSNSSQPWITYLHTPLPLIIPSPLQLLALVRSQLKVKCADCMGLMTKHNLDRGAVWHIAPGDYLKRGKCEDHWEPTLKEMVKLHTIRRRPRGEIKLIAENDIADRNTKKRERNLCDSADRPTGHRRARSPVPGGTDPGRS